MSTLSKDSLIQPYLFFNGNCSEAIEFYRSTVGAEVEMVMRYKDCPEPPPPGMIPDNWDEKVMHASFRIGKSTIMASDGCGDEASSFAGFMLSLTLPDKAECDRVFNVFAEGGEIKMPMGQTFWSPYFGMVADKFGIGWMIAVPEQL